MSIRPLGGLRWLAGCASLMLGLSTLQAQSSDFPPHAQILKDYEKVVTKANITPMYTLYQREKDGQMYAELPRTYANKTYFIATTVASGDSYAGLQSSDYYVKWRRYDKRLALIQPNISIRAEGDREAKASVNRLFTDEVLLDLPIVTIGPGGGPVIDLDALLVSNASRFFGSQALLSSSARLGMFKIATAKAFENNVEVAYEVPVSGGGGTILRKLHYSISEIPASTGYKPRAADTRVGFFTTTYTDLGKYDDEETRVRYINRWHLEKADPSLKLSPPKKPIVFYIEHTTPVRYRRWVREGILAWNEAFENIGISDAIEVYYQDAVSGAHMDKDPEDVNYNFIRWLNNDVGTAIGPSRVNPNTGQILDADIILTDGWIRHYRKQFSEQLPQVAMEGFSADTLAWLADHPDWDPRVRLAPPSMRAEVTRRIQQAAAMPMAGHPAGIVNPAMIGDDELDGLLGRTSQVNGYCLAAQGMSADLALLRMHYELGMPGYADSASTTATSIAGRWNGLAKNMKTVGFPIDALPFVFTFAAGPNGSVDGTVEFAGQSVPLEDVKFDPESGAVTASMTRAEDNVTVRLAGRMAGDELSGEWSVAGETTASGAWTATRETSAAQKAQPAAASASAGDEGSEGDGNGAGEDEGDDEEEEGEQEEKPKPKKRDDNLLDGMPEEFVGPLVAHLVAHEVGHTMGLRHNFKASSLYTMKQINSDEVAGKKQLAGSVMDYIGVNIAFGEEQEQGDYCMTGIGPYDLWAIEYGYTFSDPKKVLERVAEPELVYGTDEDTGGPDPLARRYDFSKDPLEYAETQMRLAKYHRERLLSEFIEDGDSWDRIRYGYELTLNQHTKAVSMMANWVGGAFVYRDKKGDPNGRKPIEVVPADQQRRALSFVVNNSFNEEAFGLTPEILTSMGLDKWSDDRASYRADATWPVHDRIMSIQSSALTMLMNPTTLSRVYDNEFRVPADQDALTLPELLSTVSDAVWSELGEKAKGKYSARKPLVSSLRRNLQREHLERLIDLTLPGSNGAAGRAISMLSAQSLRDIAAKIEAAQAAAADRHDPYTAAHLAQALQRIEKALDADYILNPGSGGGRGGGGFIIFGNDTSGAESLQR